jgi:hypothetical protein
METFSWDAIPLAPFSTISLSINGNTGHFFACCCQNLCLVFPSACIVSPVFTEFLAKLSCETTIFSDPSDFEFITNEFHISLNDDSMSAEAAIEYTNLKSFLCEDPRFARFFQTEAIDPLDFGGLVHLSLAVVYRFFIRRHFFPRSLLQCQIFPVKPIKIEKQDFTAFLFLRSIGSGGFGSVSMFMAKQNGDIFAIKEYHPLFDGPRKTDRELMRREVASLTRFTHRAILRCYGYIERSFLKQCKNCLILEFMPYGSVRDLLGRVNESKNPPKAWNDSLKLKMIISVLFALHDLKGVPPTREHLRTGKELRYKSSISLETKPSQAKWVKRGWVELIA